MKTKKLVYCAVFIAITFILGFAEFFGLPPIGIIPIPPANITIMHIPIIVGTIFLGLRVGLILGFTFGISSFFKVLFIAPSTLIAPIFASSPIITFLIAVVPRLLIPIVIYYTYKLFSKKANKTVSAVFGSLLGTLTNTIFYLGLMLLAYVLLGFDSSAVITVILGAGALNGSLEALAAMLICPPVIFALQKTIKLETLT